MSRKRNHAEVVKVTFDPARTSLKAVLIGFWENHDPTQGDRQGNDIGSNYRSAIYTRNEAQAEVARKTRDTYTRRRSVRPASAASRPRSRRSRPTTRPRTTTRTISRRTPTAIAA